MTASFALKSAVRTRTQNLPFIASAGMFLFKFDHVAFFKCHCLSRMNDAGRFKTAGIEMFFPIIYNEASF